MEQAAEPLGIKVRGVRGLIRAGELKAVRIGRQIRVPESALADYIDRLVEAAAV